MRVITGSARGVHLKGLTGQQTRPTTDRVKEGLFSAIHFEIEGRTVLDLFAGTGQLGIEALSRGAKSAVFVERQPQAQKMIQQNLALTRLEERGQVVGGDAVAYLRACRIRYGLIFLDPPYDTGLLEQALENIAMFDICQAHGIIVAESPLDAQLPVLAAPYSLYCSYAYGKIKVSIYHRDSTEGRHL